MSCFQEQSRWPSLSFVPCVEGEARKCRLQSLWRWSCWPRPEHVTLLFKSVCVSHCLLAVQHVGWFLGCASFLIVSVFPSRPLRRCAGPSGLLGSGNQGSPAFGSTPGSPSIAQAKTQPQKSATRRRGVFTACRLVLSRELVGMGWGLHFPRLISGPPTPPEPALVVQRGRHRRVAP